jgi:hypothetical protein
VFVLNVVSFAAFNPSLSGLNRRRILPETAVPMIPWEFLNCVLTAMVVLAWALSGSAPRPGCLWRSWCRCRCCARSARR